MGTEFVAADTALWGSTLLSVDRNLRNEAV